MTLDNDQIKKIIQQLLGSLDFRLMDQQTDLDQYISERRGSYEPESTQNYQDIEDRRKHLEASVVCLIRNPADKCIAEKTFQDIEECFYNRENESNWYEFEKGIAEGFLLAFNLLAPKLIANNINVNI
jgi:6-pyruvoyl-tetrahydropterin synthase